MNLIYDIHHLNKVLLERRARGIRIDLNRAKEVSDILGEMEYRHLKNIRDYAEDHTFNPNSTKELPKLLDKFGIKYPYTEAGNPSVAKEWLMKQTHPVCLEIQKHRKLQKARRDYCDTVIEMQEYLPKKMRGRVYPNYNLLGAAATGRPSCSKPNILQVPRRDEETGPLIRSIYLPEDNEQWYSLDYSGQEPRITLHYALAMKIPGASEWLQYYLDDEKMSVHDMVVKLIGMDREYAKMTALCLSYGGGISTVARKLGKTQEEATEIVNQFYEALPYLKPLTKYCEELMRQRGYIKTIGGRHLRVDPPRRKDGRLWRFEYRAMNYLVQGSAADQMYMCEVALDKLGIPMLFSVYDELNFSAKDDETALFVKETMENILDLNVPMHVEIGSGSSWGAAK